MLVMHCVCTKLSLAFYALKSKHDYIKRMRFFRVLHCKQIRFPVMCKWIREDFMTWILTPEGTGLDLQVRKSSMVLCRHREEARSFSNGARHLVHDFMQKTVLHTEGTHSIAFSCFSFLLELMCCICALLDKRSKRVRKPRGKWKYEITFGFQTHHHNLNIPLHSDWLQFYFSSRHIF